MKLHFDPYIQKLKGLKSLNITKAKKATYDSIVLSVPHSFFLKELNKNFYPFEISGICLILKVNLEATQSEIIGRFNYFITRTTI